MLRNELLAHFAKQLAQRYVYDGATSNPTWLDMETLNLAIWNEVCRNKRGSTIQRVWVGKYQPYPVRSFPIYDHSNEIIFFSISDSAFPSVDLISGPGLYCSPKTNCKLLKPFFQPGVTSLAAAEPICRKEGISRQATCIHIHVAGRYCVFWRCKDGPLVSEWTRGAWTMYIPSLMPNWRTYGTPGP